MTDYTPTTEEVRGYYGWMHTYGKPFYERAAIRRSVLADFDRWLAAHDAEVRKAGMEIEHKRIVAKLEAEWPNEGDWGLILREVLTIINRDGEQA